VWAGRWEEQPKMSRARERAFLLLGCLLGITTTFTVLLGLWSRGIRCTGLHSNRELARSNRELARTPRGFSSAPGGASLEMLVDGGRGPVGHADLVVLGLNRKNEMEQVQLRPAHMKALHVGVNSIKTSGKSNLSSVVSSTEGVLGIAGARVSRGNSSGTAAGSTYPCSKAEHTVVVWSPCRIWRHSGGT
jgi:hypothetical protein